MWRVNEYPGDVLIFTIKCTSKHRTCISTIHGICQAKKVPSILYACCTYACLNAPPRFFSSKTNSYFFYFKFTVCQVPYATCIDFIYIGITIAGAIRALSVF